MSTSEPSVDVIVATNRLSPYLASALRSAHEQTLRPRRILVVDDGSPDPQKLRDLVGQIPGTEVLHRKPAGVSAARNAGLRAGGSDLVAFLDDDDVWEPSRLEKQVRAWDQSPNVVGVYCGGWYMGPDGQALGRGWPARAVSSEDFLCGKVPAPRVLTLLTRRDICEDLGGFDESYWLGEDNEFMLRLLQRGELACVPEALVGYRRHPGNTSRVTLTESRRATDRMLSEQITAASQRGDQNTVALLRAHVRRHHARAAPESVAVILNAIRARNTQVLRDELGWALRFAPVQTAVAAAHRVGQALRRRRSA